MSSTSAIEVRGLQVVLAANGADLVTGVTFDLRPGEVLGLVGESGSGKTTLGLSLLNHTRPGIRIAAGSVTIGGTDVAGLRGAALMRARRGLVRYIPQDPATALNPSLRVGTQLAESLGPEVTDRVAAQRDLLRAVKLPTDGHILAAYPHQLSGGQQQRIGIAMAIATAPRLLVLDEPTTGLDVTTQAHVLETIRALCTDKGIAAVYVSHDLAAVASIADKLAVMYSGRIVEYGGSRRVLARPRHPYTAALIDAVPDLGRDDPVRGIAGHAPDPSQRPPGCAFTPRCGRALPECRHDLVAREIDGRSVLCINPIAEAAPRQAGLFPVPVERAAAEADFVRVRNLVAHHGSREVLHGLSFSVPRGTCLAVVGESGSGKTTTARSLVGLHRQATGTLHLGDLAIDLAAPTRSPALRRNIQYVFQNPYGSLNPTRTVGASLAMALRQFERLPAAKVEARVRTALDRVALPAFVAGRMPRELSGGQRQRAAIARALMADPTLLICDEVTSALDVSVQAVVVDLLLELRQAQGLSMIFVTHNLALARNIAESTAVLQNGSIVEEGPSRTLLGQPSAAETIRLLADAPRFTFAEAEPA